jgi:cytochrome c-type biogenesis protein CcmH/NrfG
MKPESLVFGIAGTFLGLIAGWLIGSQQPATRAAATMAPATAASAPASTASAPASNKVVLDESEVKRLKDIAEKDPQNASPRTSLGNMYFDAERYSEAAEWYAKAIELDPTNPDVSTDLGVAYYYENQPDKALAQFKHSLEIDPKHTKTMLNQGIVLAFGKQDLAAAAKAWEEVIKIAPESPEGQAAKRALDSLKGAHPNLNGGTAGAPGTD